MSSEAALQSGLKITFWSSFSKSAEPPVFERLGRGEPPGSHGK